MSCFSTKYLFYEVFDNGLRCPKTLICDKYPQGKILIYKDAGEDIIIYSAVMPVFLHPASVRNELIDIWHPDPSNNFKCLCFVPQKENGLLLQRIRCVVNGFILNNEPQLYRTPVFVKNYNNIDYYLIANIKDSEIDAFCKQFQVSSAAASRSPET